ncbi:MAG: hypothetical protein AMJ81_08940 [Phycisphaerae bacterium SM23_33]|nr:MAG: hypothetical protein AMJ81_08940 [Phycisphaerae bacterium SM23_33]
MTRMDGKRLDASTFQIDPGIRRGRYSDEYFRNAAEILTGLAAEGYRFAGTCPALEAAGVDPAGLHTGDVEVEMQYFTKRQPASIAAGIDQAIAILRECSGFFDGQDRFHNTFNRLEVEAVHDGDGLAPWAPAMKVRGRYRDFAILETPMLGVMARGTRIATNTYEALSAAGGKPVFLFGARFDIPQTQPADGYAYKVGLERFNADTERHLPPMVTTAAQGQWWGGAGGGTTSHSLILCFLRDTTEAMLQFARLLPTGIRRIALVDTNNDCVGDSTRCALAFFRKWHDLKQAGREDEAARYVLHGVRCDTAAELTDMSVEPTDDVTQERGVCPRLVRNVRRALDCLADQADLPAGARGRARRYFRDVKIAVSGGFNPQRIAAFEAEEVPADMYGLGSFLIAGPNNDFTADVVRVKAAGTWHEMPKVGRKPMPNPDLVPVS